MTSWKAEFLDNKNNSGKYQTRECLHHHRPVATWTPQERGHGHTFQGNARTPVYGVLNSPESKHTETKTWTVQTHKPACHVGKAAVTWGTQGVTWGTRAMTGSFCVTGGTFSVETKACTGSEAPWVLDLQGRRLQGSEPMSGRSAGDSAASRSPGRGQAQLLEVLLWRTGPPGGLPNRRLEFVRRKPGDGELRAQCTEVLKGHRLPPGAQPCLWVVDPEATLAPNPFLLWSKLCFPAPQGPSLNPPSWLRENPALPMTSVLLHSK